MEIRSIHQHYILVIFLLYSFLKGFETNGDTRGNNYEDSAQFIRDRDDEEPKLANNLRRFDVSCGRPTPPDNGFITGTDYGVGGTVTAACKDGYRLIGTPTSRCFIAPDPFYPVVIWDPHPDWHCQAISERSLPPVDPVLTDMSNEVSPVVSQDAAQTQFTKSRHIRREYKTVPDHSMEDVPERCTLPKKVGRCKAAIPAFYFNTESKECEPFLYGGCGGNDNNFETAEACDDACHD